MRSKAARRVIDYWKTATDPKQTQPRTSFFRVSTRWIDNRSESVRIHNGDGSVDPRARIGASIARTVRNHNQSKAIPAAYVLGHRHDFSDGSRLVG